MSFMPTTVPSALLVFRSCEVSPYLFLKSTYLVRDRTRYSATTDFDRLDVRIAVTKNVAYDVAAADDSDRAPLLSDQNFGD
jgi:hypothetical protein